jgi:hypothetical protein
MRQQQCPQNRRKEVNKINQAQRRQGKNHDLKFAHEIKELKVNLEKIN